MNNLGWAGAETQLYHLAAGLSEAGQSVTLLAVGGVHIDVQPLTDTGVEVVALGATCRMAKIRKTLDIARYARRSDVVHCTGYDASLWGRIGAVLARRPVVVTEHSGGRSLQVTKTGASRARMIALHNRVLDRVTYATIAVGTRQIAQLESEGVRREAIVHIPNGVPVERLREESLTGPSRSELGLPDDAKVVIQVARISPGKGQLSTLRAVSHLRERGLGDIRLIFVGEGPAEDSLEQEAARMKAHWVTFLGRRDDVPGLLGLADLCVLPSTSEGLPMSLIEALAVGTPMVATDVGDIRWLLESTGGGICVPPGAEEEFTDACARVLEDADLRERLSSAAKSAAADFDAQRMTRRYLQVLDAAVTSAPLPLVLTG
jgi:glycosyltransferase involved in cell wall biosynthesis